VLHAADTNVLVRLVVSDDLVQQRAVVARLTAIEAAGETVLVPSIVLVEMSWVLESVYGYGREDVIRALEAIMTTSPFMVEERAEAVEALETFRKGKAGFGDYMILAVSRARGAGRLLTFDRKLLRHAGYEKP
jgi:predicted nucleic-acid-binding protein